MSKSLHQLKNLSEVRSLPNSVEKALFLHKNYQVSFRKLSLEFKVPKTNLQRAFKQKEERGFIRKKGRPNHLLLEEEKQLVERIEKNRFQTGEDLTQLKVLAEVTKI